MKMKPNLLRHMRRWEKHAHRLLVAISPVFDLYSKVYELEMLEINEVDTPFKH